MENLATTGRDDVGHPGGTGAAGSAAGTWRGNSAGGSAGTAGVAGAAGSAGTAGGVRAAGGARAAGSAGSVGAVGSAGSEGSIDVGTAESPATEVADTTALPVALSLHGRDGDAVRRWVEGTLGWQPVDAATDALVPPAVVLRDLAVHGGHLTSRGRSLPADEQSSVRSGAPSGDETGEDIPVVLVTPDDAPAVEVAAQAVTIRPAAVIGWPSGRDQLDAVVQQVLARPRARRRHTRTVRVGGAAGGVGTTTVAFALAGMSAWRSQRTVVAVRGAGVAGREVPTAALAAADVYSQAEPLAGMVNLRALKLTDWARLPELVDETVDTLIVDAGVDVDADVLVCRRDAAGRQMVAETSAAAVVVVGDGPVAHKELVGLAAGRPVISVPWSARVARAGAITRLPASLPGAWLRRLAPLTPAAPRSATHESAAIQSAINSPVIPESAATGPVANGSEAGGSVVTGPVANGPVAAGSLAGGSVVTGSLAGGSAAIGPVANGSEAGGSPALDVGASGSAVSR